MTFGLTTTDLEKIRQVFAHFPEIESVVIFGSRAMGNYKNGSDVDLALKGPVTEEMLREVSSHLNQKLPLPYFFDVVIYNQIQNAELKKHIDEEGRVF